MKLQACSQASEKTPEHGRQTEKPVSFAAGL